MSEERDLAQCACQVCFDAGRVRAVKHEGKRVFAVEEPCPMKCGAVKAVKVMKKARNPLAASSDSGEALP